jgi:hypothetical protein
VAVRVDRKSVVEESSIHLPTRRRKGKVTTPQLQRAFLAAFSRLGVLISAEEASGVKRETHWRWMKEDPTYPERYEAAREAFGDTLEEAARKRAVEGYEQFIPNPKTGVAIDERTGEPIKQRVYSDRLMEVMLKAKRRSEYGEKVEVGGIGGQQLFSKPEPQLVLIQVRQVMKSADVTVPSLPAAASADEVIDAEVIEVPAEVSAASDKES